MAQGFLPPDVVAYLRYNQVINQFLAKEHHYCNALFCTLATARNHSRDFITCALVCDTKGRIRPADKK